jgi:hypothetical protein
LLTLNDEFTTSIVVGRCRQSSVGSLRWLIRFDTSLEPDITIAVRLDVNNEGILDYYIIPRIAELNASVRFAPDNPLSLEVYRFDDLEYFVSLGKRRMIEEVA